MRVQECFNRKCKLLVSKARSRSKLKILDVLRFDPISSPSFFSPSNPLHSASLEDSPPGYLQSLRGEGTLGTIHQQMAPATIRERAMGCSTCTPARAAISPVREGKMAPPACATTNTKPWRFVSARVSYLGRLPLEDYVLSAGA